MSAFTDWMEKEQRLVVAGAKVEKENGEAGIFSNAYDAMEIAWDAAIATAARACEQWGSEKVEKWEAVGDPEMVIDAKARAWDGLQCAVAVRALHE